MTNHALAQAFRDPERIRQAAAASRLVRLVPGDFESMADGSRHAIRRIEEVNINKGG